MFSAYPWLANIIRIIKIRAEKVRQYIPPSVDKVYFGWAIITTTSGTQRTKNIDINAGSDFSSRVILIIVVVRLLQAIHMINTRHSPSGVIPRSTRLTMGEWGDRGGHDELSYHFKFVTLLAILRYEHQENYTSLVKLTSLEFSWNLAWITLELEGTATTSLQTQSWIQVGIQVTYGRRDRRASIRNSISDFWVEPQWWSPNPNLSAGFWPIKEVTWPTHMVFWWSINAARLHRVAQNLAAAPRTCRIRTNYVSI